MIISIDALSQINRIIEQDKISSTYKYALLKNTIDVCQRYDHLIEIKNNNALLPFGLVIEGWIFDYLPFVFIVLHYHKRPNVESKMDHATYYSLTYEMTTHYWRFPCIYLF